MKSLNRLGKILLYTLLSLLGCVAILSTTLYYRLAYQQQPINFSQISINYHSLTLRADSITLLYDKPSQIFTIQTAGNNGIYHKLDPVLITKSCQITAKLGQFWSDFIVPIAIDINSSQLFADALITSTHTKSKSNNNAHKIIKEIHSFINNISREKLFFIQKIQIIDTKIEYKNLTYSLDIVSSLDAQNQLNGTLNLTTATSKSQAQLTITNSKKLIDTKLVFDYFPIELITDFIPKEYYIKVLDHADNDAIMTGSINYIIDSDTKLNSFSLDLQNKNAAEIQSTNQHAINTIKIKIVSDDYLKHTRINNFSLKLTNNVSFKMKATILQKTKLLADTLKIDASISGQNIPINSMDVLWPLEVLPPVRAWLTGNMHNGVAEKITCEVKINDINNITPQDIDASIWFKNVDLKYDQDYEQLTNLNGIAKFDTHSVKINVDSGQMLAAKINQGTVEIIYDDTDLPLIVTATTEGAGKNYLNFIGKRNLEKIESIGLDLSNINSAVTGKLYLKIPLGKDISLDKTILDVHATLDNTSVDFRNNIKLTEAKLDLIVNNKEVKIDGVAKINDQPSKLVWFSNLGNTKSDVIDHKLNLDLDLAPNLVFEQALANNFKITSGSGKAALEYISYPKNESLIISADLTAANFMLPRINLVEDSNQSCYFNLNLAAGEDKIWHSNKFELLSGKNISITGNIDLEPNLSDIRIFNGDFKFKDNNFAAKYQNIDQQVVFSLIGDKLDLSQTEILHLLKPGQNKFTQAKINLDLKNVIMANEATFQNVKAAFDCGQKHCNTGSLTLNTGPETSSSIDLTRVKNQSQWKIATNDAATFLRAFRIYRNIKGGKLNMTLTSVSPSKTQIEPVYRGEAELLNFTATKTPILAKLISFSSFRGILSILQNYRSIPFQKMRSNFVLAGDMVRINETFFTGDFLTLTVNGTIDLNKEYINFHGKVIPPVYGFNYILSLLPFVGHQLAGDEGKKGLIAANYTIKGPFDNTKAFVNPIGIFMPQIFMGFLTP